MADRLEAAIDARLSAKKLATSEVGKEITTIRTPSCHVAVISGRFTRTGSKYRHELKVILGVCVKNVRTDGEKERRKEMHPLVAALVADLTGERLGLEIQDLEPVSWGETTTEPELRAGLMSVNIQFSTSCEEPLKTIDAPDLEAVVASFHQVTEGPAPELVNPPLLEMQITLETP